MTDDQRHSPRNVPRSRPGPAGGKRDTNRRMRTEALCRAGLDIMLERGIAVVTIDEIAKRAGTAKGNFYRYLADKEDLVRALLEPLAEAIEQAMDRCETHLAKATAADAITTAYKLLAIELVVTLRRHEGVVLLYLQEGRGPAVGARSPLVEFADTLTRKTIHLTEMAHRQGLLRDIEPKLSALAVIGAIERLLLVQLRGTGFDDAQAAAEGLVRLVMEGLIR